MTEIPREKWNPVDLGGGKMSAAFNCPFCGAHGTLEDHEIKADGTVEPSLICPNDEKGCMFHDHVRLLGWSW